MTKQKRGVVKQLGLAKGSGFFAQESQTEAASQSEIPSSIYEMPIEELNLSARTYNSLKRAGITKVGDILDLLKMGEKDILALRNFGQASLNELAKKIKAIQPRNQQNDDRAEEEYLGIGIFEENIRLVSLDRDGQYRFIDGTQKLHNILYIATTEALALKLAIEELEDLMNDPKANEQAFQDFFERNPQLILNDEYKRAHARIALAREEGTLIPDFLLEPLDQSSLCDILDLKLPMTNIFVLKKSRMRFSAAVMEACAQLREYNIYFEDKENRDRIYREYGLLAYRPKMIVIIGRRGDVDPISFCRIQSDLPHLVLRTYDDVVNRAKSRLKEVQ